MPKSACRILFLNDDGRSMLILDRCDDGLALLSLLDLAVVVAKPSREPLECKASKRKNDRGESLWKRLVERGKAIAEIGLYARRAGLDWRELAGLRAYPDLLEILAKRESVLGPAANEVEEVTVSRVSPPRARLISSSRPDAPISTRFVRTSFLPRLSASTIIRGCGRNSPRTGPSCLP